MTIAKKVLPRKVHRSGFSRLDHLREKEQELHKVMRALRREIAEMACSVPIGDGAEEIPLAGLFRYLTQAEIDKAKCRLLNVNYQWIKYVEEED